MTVSIMEEGIINQIKSTRYVPASQRSEFRLYLADFYYFYNIRPHSFSLIGKIDLFQNESVGLFCDNDLVKSNVGIFLR